MTRSQTASAQAWSLMGQAEQPPSVLFGETELELWPYRRRTIALLRRYARASVEVGRLPSLLGREFFRSRVTSYTMRNFEDVVIFVADMEQAIEKLNAIEKKLLAMNVLEEYTIPEVARLLGCTQRTVERFLQDALDQLSRILLAGGLMEKLPSVTGGSKTCQEGKNYNFDLSDSNEGENKRDYALDTRLPIWYCLKHEFYFSFRFGAGFVWSFKCLRTDFTISGWNKCFSASSSVISIGCFFDLFGMGDLMTEAIDLCELVERYPDDQQCRNYLEHLRWPQGIRCPKCGGERVSSILKRDQHNCDSESCGYQFSVTAGTIFHDTHLPLTKWFLAVYLICQSRKGMSANQLKRMLRINYRTAWYLCHRIRHAMAEDVPLGKLDGTVEVDETYVGGKKIGWGVGAGKRAKEVVIGIRQRQGDLRFFHAEDAKSGTLAKYIKENVSGDVDVIMTDEFVAYPFALRRIGVPSSKHRTVAHRAKQYVDGDIHTNTVESAFSLLKRGIVGTWHRVSAKHLAAYLDEMTWRFNNRKNPFLFRDTMLKLIHSENLEYKELTKAA